VYGVPVKTTVVLRDGVYEYLVKKFGRRKISEAINQAVMKQLFKPPSKSMFGVDPWLTTKNLRDEEEPHEAS
jgi:response regulator of citrate/malate metabolism